MKIYLEENQTDYKIAGIRCELIRDSILPSGDEMYLFKVHPDMYEVWVNGLCIYTFHNKNEAERYMHLLFIRSSEKRHRYS